MSVKGEPVLAVAEALLRISSRQFLREMNMTLDFSFLDTPRSNVPIRCASTCRLVWLPVGSVFCRRCHAPTFMQCEY